MKCFVVATNKWKKGGRERGEEPELVFAWYDGRVVGWSNNLRAGSRFDKAEEAIEFLRMVRYVWACKAKIYNAFIPRLKRQPTVDLGFTAVEPDEAELLGEFLPKKKEKKTNART